MKIKVGAATITAIYEQDLHGINGLIPEATAEQVRQIKWLAPHFSNEAGEMCGVIQAFVIEVPGHLIVVDTCVGDNKERLVLDSWNKATTGFLDRFHAEGFNPGDVDIVLCTHLHLDHVGWNTYWSGSGWEPTFPNARYLFADVELEHWAKERAHPVPDLGQISDPHELSLVQFGIDQRQTYADSVQPIMAAGLADIVRVDHRISDEVHLISTPGHTPGHVSVVIRSEGQQALITGDCFHHPCQIARPDWGTIVDVDPELGIATRETLLGQMAASGGLLIGSHFSEPTAGRVVADGAGFRLVTDDL